MELTVSYILSQVFTIIMYVLLALTYYAKDRKKVLILNFAGLISIGIAYVFLDAWSGLAMCVIALARNIIFLVDENKNGKRDKINKTDIIILIVLFAISIISAVLTYDGFFSLFSAIATMLYTFSVWQKKTSIYKLLGIPTGIAWVIYNTYLMSIFGIIFESILLICSITGYILEMKASKKAN